MRRSPESLAGELQSLMGKPTYRPLKDHEIAKLLRVRESERDLFRSVMRDLERAGRITCLRKNRWSLPDTRREITGRLSVNVHGLGFLTPEQPGIEDIAIDKDGMGAALHGDVVAVELSGRRRAADGSERQRGRITRIIERRVRTLAGVLQRSRDGWHVVPENPRFQVDIRVREFAKAVPAPHEHHLVVITLDPADSPDLRLAGVVTEDLGPPDKPGTDMLSILRSHNLQQEFEQDVVDEARRRSPELTPADLVGRLDLRKMLTYTIDPEDAKDFDDAISLEKNRDGHWRLGVHIADVAHFVQQDTVIDREARERGNSVYMVDRFIPMLPKHLTSDVCSLRPAVDRLTHSVLLTIDAHGRVLKHETARSVIHSDARLTYDQVQAFMDRRADHGIPVELHASLKEMIQLAGLLRKIRMNDGALDLSMPEVKCVLDAEGRVLDIHKRGAPEAYHLIEECMLLANVAVATLMADKEIPALYRIHEPPTDEQWADIAADLHALEIRAEPQDRRDLQKITRSIAGKPIEYAGNLAILRNLKRALYSPSRIEHFGLAFDTYTHFTSPIRRYPDLIVHRILNAIEQRRPPPYTHTDIARLASHCSDTEREADEAENESLSVKRIAFFADKLARGEIGPLNALIVSIVSRGLIVETLDTLQRGLVAFASMTDDYYTHDKARGRAVGRRQKNVWKLGQPISVELMRVDTYRRLVDFRVAGPPPAAKTGPRGRPPRPRHRRR